MDKEDIVHDDYFPCEQEVHPSWFFNLVNEVPCQGLTHSSDCSQRLEALSSALTCFSRNSTCEISISDKSLYRCDTERGQKVKDLDGGASCTKRCQPCSNDDTRGAGAVDSLTCWYKQGHGKLANEEFLIRLLQLQESSQCVFASHIIKKIICACAMQYEKIEMILGFIEATWIRTETLGGDELDLIKSFLSSHQDGNASANLSRSRKQVCNWLLGPMASLWSTMVTKFLRDKRDAFQENMLLLSILGKLFKECSSRRQDIPMYLGNLILDILESHKEIFFSFAKSDNTKGHFLLIKFIKIVDKFITGQVCFGKVKPFGKAVDCCDKILQFFPTMFDMCVSHGYVKAIGFIGEACTSDSRKRWISPPLQSPNLAIVRGMLVMVVKAAAVIVLADHMLKDDFVTLFQTTWACMHSWMEKRFGELGSNPDWILTLLGDQDDQWIQVLLSLLLIFQEISPTLSLKQQTSALNHKYEGIIPPASTSTNTYSNNDAQIWSSICPHKLFTQFMEFISFDHIVVSDFLMSPETNFLQYLSKYLTYLNNNWSEFVSFCVHCSHDAELTNNTTSVNHPEVEKEMSLKPECMLPISNQRDDLDMKNVIVSNKRKNENVHRFPLVKAMRKRSDIASPLVWYSDTDPDSDSQTESPSSSDNDSEKPEARPERIIHSFKFKSLNNTTCKQNGVVIDDDGDYGTNLNEKDHHLNSNTWFSSMTSSSSCTQSNKEAKLALNEDENENEYQNPLGAPITGLPVGNVLETSMTMLIRLRFHIERLHSNNLFPYNADPLLNLISLCEEKYESM